MKTNKIAIIAATAALLFGVANLAVAEDHEAELEYITPPTFARPCKEVITDAIEYCAPFVMAIYNRIYAVEGRKAAVCKSKVSSYHCTAEAICAECSLEESVYYEAKWRAYLQRYHDHSICKPYQYAMKTNESYCDYLEWKGNRTSTTPLAVKVNSTITANATKSSTATTPQADDSKKSAPTGLTAWSIALIVLLIFIALPIALWYGVKYFRNKWYARVPHFRLENMDEKIV